MPAQRYILSIDAVREGGRVVYHDSEHLSEACNTDDIRRKSRFNDADWAASKGYIPCGHCMPPASGSPMAAPDAADATWPTASGSYIIEEADDEDDRHD